MLLASRLTAMVAALVGATALLATSAAPASADSNTVSFTLVGGSLSVVQPMEAATVTKSGPDTTLSAMLGTVTVLDQRGGTNGWTASATTTTFSSATDGTVSTGVSYDAGSTVTAGTVTATSTGATALTAQPTPVVTGTAVSGTNTASWTPTVSVTVPDQAATGNFAGTVYVSVA